jgi:PAS domain-containing protein
MSVTRQFHTAPIQDPFHLADFFDSCPIPFAILSGDLRLIRANPRMAQVLDVPAHELIGQALEEMIPDMASRARPILSKVAETAEPDMEFHIAGELKNAPGLTRNWLCSCFPLERQQSGAYTVGVAVVEVTDTVQDAFLPLREKYQRDVR